MDVDIYNFGCSSFETDAPEVIGVCQEVKIISGFVQYSLIRKRRSSKPSGGRFFNLSVVTLDVPGVLLFFICLMDFFISFSVGASPISHCIGSCGISSMTVGSIWAWLLNPFLQWSEIIFRFWSLVAASFPWLSLRFLGTEFLWWLWKPSMSLKILFQASFGLDWKSCFTLTATSNTMLLMLNATSIRQRKCRELYLDCSSTVP